MSLDKRGKVALGAAFLSRHLPHPPTAVVLAASLFLAFDWVPLNPGMVREVPSVPTPTRLHLRDSDALVPVPITLVTARERRPKSHLQHIPIDHIQDAFARSTQSMRIRVD